MARVKMEVTEYAEHEVVEFAHDDVIVSLQGEEYCRWVANGRPDSYVTSYEDISAAPESTMPMLRRPQADDPV